MQNLKNTFLYLVFLSISLLIACNKEDNNDPEPSFEATVSISASESMVTEDIGTVDFTISLDKNNTSGEQKIIKLSILGTATDEEDFSGGISSISIDPNASSATFSLSITDDNEEEDNETIIVSLDNSQPEGITADITSVTVTISDNDMEEVSSCDNDNSLSTSDIGCPFTNPGTGTYSESIDSDIRTISANTVPNHNYGDARNEFAPLERTYTMDATPSKSNSVTSVLSDENRPRYWYGIALNGVIYAPAPATPFIFVDETTGEYNWDWVFEPTTNKGPDQGQVKLDCSSAHIGPQGYHYHGNMFEYVETIQAGLSTGTAPSAPVHVGWAADGFPIIYQYGPDANGNLVKLTPSYQLKDGERPGDGITAPCGPYNGKYTVDWEYIEGLGDLDECNGIDRQITLTTSNGSENFDYFYVITEDFPQIGRCFSGTPDESFR